MRRGALFLTLMWAASGTPALADLLNVELTVSYLAPDTFPAHSHLVATATFYIDANGPQPTDSPGLIYLDVFDRNVTVIEDPSLLDHPCITDGSCGVDTSVRGTAGGFAVFAFPNTVDQSEQLVAYDPGPLAVGTWKIKMSVVPVVLVATGIVLLAWNRRRRSRVGISK